MDYGKIIKTSFEVVKKNKWLWIYGALLGGGGFQGSGGGGNNTNTNDTKLPEFDMENVGRESASVLGTFTTNLEKWFQSVSAGSWAILLIGVVAAIIIGIIVSVILNAWAKSSLIIGVQMALNNQSPTLENTSPNGMRKIRDMVRLWFVGLGISILFSIALGILGVIVFSAFSISQNAGIIALLLIGLPGAFIGIAGYILIGMTGIYSERLVVLNAIAPYQAWKKGFNLAKKNFGSTAIMATISAVVSAIFGFIATILSLIIIAIPGAAMVIPSIINKEIPGVPVFLFIGLLLLIFITAVSAISGIVNVFKYSNWNQMFAVVTDEKKQ